MSQNKEVQQMQFDSESLMNKALRHIQINDTQLDIKGKINLFLNNVTSRALRNQVNDTPLLCDKVALIYNFASFYETVSSIDTNEPLKKMIHKPIEVQSREERLIWDMRVHALKYHNSWKLRNSYYKSNNMDSYYEIESKIYNCTHSMIYELNQERKKTETIIKYNVQIVKKDEAQDDELLEKKRQKRCAAPKKVKRVSSVKNDTFHWPALRQREAKLDCKRWLRKYYQENDE